MKAADRLALALRLYVFAACALALPVFVVSYAKLISLAHDSWGAGWFAVAMVSHLTVWIAAAMLHDSRAEKRSR